ncbi:MAG: vWA domain-containing protein [Bacteroidales bacterium]
MQILNIIYTSKPLVLVLLCLLVGFVYAYFLYYFKNKGVFTKTLTAVLFAVRLVTVSFLCFLLLSPYLLRKKTIEEKPIIIIAQDNSESILGHNTSDKIKFISDYENRVNNFASQLSDKFEVHQVLFGDEVRDINDDSLNFSDKTTNISDVFKHVNKQYYNRNIASVLLFSDGIYNKGLNPVYLSSDDLKFPVQTVALGDTNVIPDIKILKINANDYAFLGNEFPVEVEIKADKLKDRDIIVDIIKAEKVLYSNKIKIDNNDFYTKIKTNIKAEDVGVNHYRVRIKPADGEENISNNYKSFYIDVIENKQRVAIIYSSPHPDIAALRQAIKNNDNLSVEVFSYKELDKNNLNYDMLILHQVPDIYGITSDFADKITDLNIPYLNIVGTSTDIGYFNKYFSLVQIPSKSMLWDAVTPVYNNSFSWFQINSSFIDIVNDYPPLKSIIGEYKASSILQPVLYQKVGSYVTQSPIMLVGQDFNNKMAYILGEGIWRWRMNTFVKTGDYRAFDDFINSVIQYLTVKGDKGRFRVKSKASFAENEQVVFDVEFYNKSYQLINTPEVVMDIFDTASNQYTYTFSRTDNYYTLNINNLSAGEYTYSVSTSFEDEDFVKNGKIMIEAIEVEGSNLIANHSLLYQLAEVSNGSLFAYDDLESLSEYLMSNTEYKTLIHHQKQYTQLIDFKLIMFLIVFLLGFEWFMRKYFGSY